MREWRYCAWCGIEMSWWKLLLLRVWCSDCSQKYSPSDHHDFHSRVGMRENR